LTGEESIEETPVLVVGGGPSGLAASITLSRLDVPHVLVNTHPETLPHRTLSA
jgi:2,4-dichlorophenol 6-monooxygenase